MENFHHLPVLLKECMAQLNLRDGCDYLDCTLGGGGHSSQILAGVQGGSLTGIDRDADAISAWAVNGVALCTARGLVQGDPQGRFRPQSDLTRAQIAAILSRMAE